MQISYKIFLTGVTFAGLATTSLLAAGETDAQLLKQTKIGKAQAEKIGLAKVANGKIESAEIEHEHRALVRSFDIVKPGSKDITEVLVNAKTDNIIDLSTENPTAQAKESATDKAAGNH